jgi:hypothetical protein
MPLAELRASAVSSNPSFLSVVLDFVKKPVDSVDAESVKLGLKGDLAATEGIGNLLVLRSIVPSVFFKGAMMM